MTPDTAFDTFQTTVNADPEQLAEARRRRDVVLASMSSQADTETDDCFVSGSLARGTQRGLIHDVDIVVIYTRDDHPTWGSPGASTEQALEHARSQVKDALGTDGDDGTEIRHTLLRNHSVKCFLDDPDDPKAFTVDIVPAFRQDNGRLWVPERLTATWIESDPQHLIREVARRHSEWDRFVPLVRLLKHWNAGSDSQMKNLAVEILALQHLPAADTRQDALQRFFTAASANIMYGIEDPAGVCGAIQPDLDLTATKNLLDAAATTAWDAYMLGLDGDGDHAVCKWGELFGPDFPEPPGGCDSGGNNGWPTIIVPTPRRVADAPQG